MNLKEVQDIEGFFKVVDSCTGHVELVTAEGDRLNLKSKLCQYLSLANIFSEEADIPDLMLVASDPDDVDKLMEFMKSEKNKKTLA